MSFITPYAIIDLVKYKKNLLNIRDFLDTSVQIMVIVKANAYGHGSIELSTIAERLGVKHFGVATLEEAIELRQNKVSGEILILGTVHPRDLDLVVIHDLTISISSEFFINELNGFNKNLKFHLKIDTGLSRNGIYVHNEKDFNTIRDLIIMLSKNKNLRLNGIYTHFSTADSIENNFTDYQFDLFTRLLKHLKKSNINYGLSHCANSAATISKKYTHLDMVRIGLLSYGLRPVMSTNINVEPIMSIFGFVVQIKSLEIGDTVGYGMTYRATRVMKIAIVNLGYADGINRALSNKGYVLVNGSKAYIVGRISMDACVIDITNLKVEHFDKVVFVGNSGNSQIQFNDMANLINTIPYELMCCIGNRVSRKYIEY